MSRVRGAINCGAFSRKNECPREIGMLGVRSEEGWNVRLH